MQPEQRNNVQNQNSEEQSAVTEVEPAVPVKKTSIIKKILITAGVLFGLFFIIGIIGTFSSLGSIVSRGSLKGAGCRDFINTADEHSSLPNYQLVGRKIGHCSHITKDFYEQFNGMSYIFQSNQKSADLATYRTQLIEALVAKGWNAGINGNYITIALKQDARMNGSVEIVGTSPNTVVVVISATEAARFPEGKEIFPDEVIPTADELVAKAPFRFYKPTFTPSTFKQGKFEADFQNKLNYFISYRIEPEKNHINDQAIQIDEQPIPSDFNLDTNCATDKPQNKKCYPVLSTSKGMIYSENSPEERSGKGATPGALYMPLDHTLLIIHANYVPALNFDLSGDLPREELIKLMESLVPSNSY